MNLIAVNNVSVAYGANTVLRDVNLSLAPGEIVTVVGPNGSGKTSLLRAIIGASEPTKGSVQIKPGLKMGYVPQRLHIDQTLPITVGRFLRLTAPVSRTHSQRALKTAGVPDLLERQMTQLSGGQLQRVLLARALIDLPEVLLLDEATQGLDQPGSAAFYRQIEFVRSETGCAVLMISHDLHVVMSASDRVICINGRICCEGTPAVVATAPEYRALFGAGTDGALALYRHEHGSHQNHQQEAAE